MKLTLFQRSKNFSVKKLPLRVFFILNISLLFSCSSQGVRAPVDRMAQPGSIRISHHIVAKGETLYAIAWRYSLDYKDLAKINKISAPYRIFPGRKLKLKGVAPKQPYKSPANISVQSVAAKSPKKVPASVVERPVKTVLAHKNRSKNKTEGAVDVKSPTVKSSALVWSWPVNGSLVGSFGSVKGLNKGIDIAAKLGESVRAATEGRVVYAGSGLRGYGKLVIVKHRNSYLSAYAHNRKLVVQEGDLVKRGQKIAEVGASGTTAVKLHFEIRRNGTPIDPLTILPRR